MFNNESEDPLTVSAKPRDDFYWLPTGTAYGENSANAVNTKGDFDDVYKAVHEEKSPK